MHARASNSSLHLQYHHTTIIPCDQPNPRAKEILTNPTATSPAILQNAEKGQITDFEEEPRVSLPCLIACTSSPAWVLHAPMLGGKIFQTEHTRGPSKRRQHPWSLPKSRSQGRIAQILTGAESLLTRVRPPWTNAFLQVLPARKSSRFFSVQSAISVSASSVKNA